MNIGDRIRSTRKKLKLTRSELKTMAGLSEGFIGEIERGESVPTIDTLLKISKAFNMTVSQLIGEESSPGDMFFALQRLLIKKPDEMKKLIGLLSVLSNDEIRAISNLIENFKK